MEYCRRDIGTHTRTRRMKMRKAKRANKSELTTETNVFVLNIHLFLNFRLRTLFLCSFHSSKWAKIVECSSVRLFVQTFLIFVVHLFHVCAQNVTYELTRWAVESNGDDKFCWAQQNEKVAPEMFLQTHIIEVVMGSVVKKNCTNLIPSIDMRVKETKKKIIRTNIRFNYKRSSTNKRMTDEPNNEMDIFQTNERTTVAHHSTSSHVSFLFLSSSACYPSFLPSYHRIL